ncbi:MAG TPA: rhodanese-like domain-containing protein [Rubrobacter sp.]|nr:rhodanese-like domain-containing protein [Rubrobacter sp.]
MENLDPLVTTDWLAAHREDEKVRVVDIRGYVDKTDLGGGRQKAEYLAAREEYDEAHIPGAVYVDWTSDITNPDDPVPAQIAPPERFTDLMSSLGIGDDTQVVVYDHAGGQFATRLWWALTYYGHDGVFVLDGGWKKWTAEDRPTTAEVPDPELAVFTPEPRSGWRTDAEALLAASEGGDAHVLDARDEGSTPVPWREGRPERGVYQGPPTSTPIASSTPRAVPSTPTRSWRGGWRRRVCPRIETSLSSPTATAGSRPRFRSLPCTGSVTRDWPTTTARGTNGVSGRICPQSVERATREQGATSVLESPAA